MIGAAADGSLPQAASEGGHFSRWTCLGGAEKNYLATYLDVDQDLQILQDFTSGSSATTLLCRRGDRLFYRKFVFGAEKDRLFAQTGHLLELRQAGVPVTPVVQVRRDERYCSYDMPYRADAVDFFAYIHAHGPAENRARLVAILDSLVASIHADAVPATGQAIEGYIQSKVVAKLETLLRAPGLAPLLAGQSLVVNGVALRNLPALAGLLEPASLRQLLAHDKVARLHGDLTVENILCCDEDGGSAGFYLIDPNGGNLLDTPLLDYAKLLQSFRGGYEFLVRTSGVTVRAEAGKPAVDFPFLPSSAYARLHADLVGYLRTHHSEAEVTSTYLHEVVHWLRLMPYKLELDPGRVPMFYAGLVSALNAVATRLDW